MEHGRARDPIAICRRKLIEFGDLTSADAELYLAEGKSAAEATNDDFPPKVVAYLDEGIKLALNSPLPDGFEGGEWVFARGPKS